MAREVNLAPITRVFLIGACIVVIVAGLKAGAGLLAPTLFAFLVAVAVVPIIHWLDRRGLPTWAAVLLVVIAGLLIGVGLIVLLSVSLASLQDNLPAYQANLATHLAGITAWLAGLGVTIPQRVTPGMLTFSRIAGVATPVISALASGLSSAFFILLLFVVFSIESQHVSSVFRRRLGSDNPAIARFVTLGASISSYFRVRAINNLFVSVTLTILLWVLGVDLAGLWGVLAFFLGFIPNIGLPLAVIPAVLLGWIEHGWITAIIVIGGALIINLIGDNVLTPRLAGKALNMSIATIFLSFIFWSWVFGPIGALISVPLTAIVLAMLDSLDETRWLAASMSADDANTPKEHGATIPKEPADSGDDKPPG